MTRISFVTDKFLMTPDADGGEQAMSSLKSSSLLAKLNCTMC